MVKLNTTNSFTDIDSEVRFAIITIYTRECAGYFPLLPVRNDRTFENHSNVTPPYAGL